MSIIDRFVSSARSRSRDGNWKNYKKEEWDPNLFMIVLRIYNRLVLRSKESKRSQCARCQESMSLWRSQYCLIAARDHRLCCCCCWYSYYFSFSLLSCSCSCCSIVVFVHTISNYQCNTINTSILLYINNAINTTLFIAMPFITLSIHTLRVSIALSTHTTHYLYTMVYM